MGFCIFLDAVAEGRVVAVHDDNGPAVFATEHEAELEIVDHLMTRLREFIEGGREFEDAVAVEEYVLPVTVHPDGVITDVDGGCHGTIR
ncbi:MAG: hypothetical protein V4733_07875 [Verrucomicrobiota bacterium]